MVCKRENEIKKTENIDCRVAITDALGRRTRQVVGEDNTASPVTSSPRVCVHYFHRGHRSSVKLALRCR